MDFQRKSSRVLVVDDEPAICLTLAYSLGAAGFDVSTAGSLGSAQEALKRDYFPVVITDLYLSGSGRGPAEGLEVLRHARQCSPKTDVIVMSADVSDELRDKVRLLGASHCYEKPYDIDDLLGSVLKLTGKPVQQ